VNSRPLLDKWTHGRYYDVFCKTK